MDDETAQESENAINLKNIKPSEFFNEVGVAIYERKYELCHALLDNFERMYPDRETQVKIISEYTSAYTVVQDGYENNLLVGVVCNQPSDITLIRKICLFFKKYAGGSEPQNLISRFVNYENEAPAFFKAVSKSNVEAVEALLNPEITFDKSDAAQFVTRYENKTALHGLMICSEKSLKILQLLLNGQANIFHKDIDGITPYQNLIKKNPKVFDVKDQYGKNIIGYVEDAVKMNPFLKAQLLEELRKDEAVYKNLEKEDSKMRVDTPPQNQKFGNSPTTFTQPPVFNFGYPHQLMYSQPQAPQPQPPSQPWNSNGVSYPPSPGF